MRHLLNALLSLTDICTRAEGRRALRRYTDRLEEDCEKFIEDRFDRKIIQKKITAIRQEIDLPPERSDTFSTSIKQSKRESFSL